MPHEHDDDPTLQKPERRNLLLEGLLRLRDLFLPSSGFHMGENRIRIKKDTDGVQNVYISRPDGTEDKMSGDVPAARVFNSANISVANSAITVLTYDSERWDNDGIHYTSSANLTGTVTKTSGSATLAGSSTAFDTELSVGQMINVPGTAVETKVVTAIASATSLTVGSNYANTASGQTAARVNSGLVALTAGKYIISASAAFDANSTGRREMEIHLNRTSLIVAQEWDTNQSSANTLMAFSTQYDLAQYDFIECRVFQNSGGALNIVAVSNYSPEFMMIREGPSGTGLASQGTDHGGLTGLGDDDHSLYLLTAGSREGSTGSAQDFGSTGVKADVIAESTSAAGVTIDSLLIKDGKHAHADHTGRPFHPFRHVVEDPISSEDVYIGFTNEAITVTEMRAVLLGSSTPSVTWTIRHGTDRNATGAEVVTSGTTTTNTTTGDDVTSFNDATIVADSHIWLETTAKSGTVDEIAITIIGTVD